MDILFPIQKEETSTTFSSPSVTSVIPILTAKGSNPLLYTEKSGSNIQCIYDPIVKSTVIDIPFSCMLRLPLNKSYPLSSSSSTSSPISTDVSIPKSHQLKLIHSIPFSPTSNNNNTTKTIGLRTFTHPYILLQIGVPPTIISSSPTGSTSSSSSYTHTSFDIEIVDTKLRYHRLSFSTAFTKPSGQELHAQIPLVSNLVIARSILNTTTNDVPITSVIMNNHYQYTALCINLYSLCQYFFHEDYHMCTNIRLSSVCRIRSIYAFSLSELSTLPNQCDFPEGVKYNISILDNKAMEILLTNFSAATVVDNTHGIQNMKSKKKLTKQSLIKQEEVDESLQPIIVSAITKENTIPTNQSSVNKPLPSTIINKSTVPPGSSPVHSRSISPKIETNNVPTNTISHSRSISPKIGKNNVPTNTISDSVKISKNSSIKSQSSWAKVPIKQLIKEHIHQKLQMKHQFNNENMNTINIITQRIKPTELPIMDTTKPKFVSNYIPYFQTKLITEGTNTNSRLQTPNEIDTFETKRNIHSPISSNSLESWNNTINTNTSNIEKQNVNPLVLQSDQTNSEHVQSVFQSSNTVFDNNYPPLYDSYLSPSIDDSHDDEQDGNNMNKSTSLIDNTKNNHNLSFHRPSESFLLISSSTEPSIIMVSDDNTMISNTISNQECNYEYSTSIHNSNDTNNNQQRTNHSSIVVSNSVNNISAVSTSSSLLGPITSNISCTATSLYEFTKDQSVPSTPSSSGIKNDNINNVVKSTFSSTSIVEIPSVVKSDVVPNNDKPNYTTPHPLNIKSNFQENISISNSIPINKVIIPLYQSESKGIWLQQVLNNQNNVQSLLDQIQKTL